MAQPRKTGRNLLVNGDFSNDYRDAWENYPQGAGVNVQQKAQSGLSFLWFLTNGLSQKVAMPFDPAKLEEDSERGYQITFHYQPPNWEFPSNKEPFYQLTYFPSERKDTPQYLPAPGQRQDYTEWLDKKSAAATVNGDYHIQLAFSAGNTSLADGAPDMNDLLNVEWPKFEGTMHIAGAHSSDADMPGIQLRLFHPPLQVDGHELLITLDDKPPRYLIEGKIPLCHGGEHVLALSVTDDCGWAGSGDGKYPGIHAYAYWLDEKTAETLGLHLTPTEPWDDTDAQHILKPWDLHCKKSENGDIDACIESIYNADTYSIAFLTGPFKTEIVEFDLGEYWPCVPLSESQTARVRVNNPLTGEGANSAELHWQLDDGAPTGDATDEQGVAEINITPSKDTKVQVSSDAPYNAAVDVKNAILKTIPTLPWGQFEVLVDGKVIDPTRQNILKFAPGETAELILRPSKASVLIGETFQLKYTKKSARGGDDMSFDPPLDQTHEISANGVTWQVKAADEVTEYFGFELTVDCKRFKNKPVMSGSVLTRLKIQPLGQIVKWPVVPLEESITLSVRVSDFESDVVEPDILVRWEIDGEILGESTTNSSGIATFTYVPKGRSTIAAVMDHFADEEYGRCEIEVPVFLLRPEEQFELVLNGQTVPSDERPVYKVGENTLLIKPAANCELIGHTVVINANQGSDFPAGVRFSLDPKSKTWAVSNAESSTTFKITVGDLAQGSIDFSFRTDKMEKTWKRVLWREYQDRLVFSEAKGISSKGWVGASIAIKNWVTGEFGAGTDVIFKCEHRAEQKKIGSSGEASAGFSVMPGFYSIQIEVHLSPPLKTDVSAESLDLP